MLLADQFSVAITLTEVLLKTIYENFTDGNKFLEKKNSFQAREELLENLFFFISLVVVPTRKQYFCGFIF